MCVLPEVLDFQLIMLCSVFGRWRMILCLVLEHKAILGTFMLKVVRCCIWLAALQQNLICSFVDGIFLLYLYTLTFKSIWGTRII